MGTATYILRVLNEHDDEWIDRGDYDTASDAASAMLREAEIAPGTYAVVRVTEYIVSTIKTGEPA